MSTPFKYERGKTKVECDHENKEGIRIGKRDSLHYWIIRYLIVGAIVYRILTTDIPPSILKAITQAIRQ